MFLTREEELLYKGQYGAAAQKAMEILVALGDLYDADRLIEITSAHISGVTYRNAGNAGLKLVENLAENRASLAVTTTLNPIGMELERWKYFDIPEEFAEKQLRIVRAYGRMGAIPTYTCTPYLVGNVLRAGEHIAWAESSDIIFANSVFGAKTNRESNPSALAAAIIGKTPRYGCHLKENRYGNVLVNVENELKDISDYGALGFYVGAKFPTETPVFTGIPSSVNLDKLKHLGAALATSGAMSIFHMVGVTPEAKSVKEALGGEKPLDKITVTRREIKATYEELCRSEKVEVDFVYTGCPHASLGEVKKVALLLKGKKISTNIKMWVSTSSVVKSLCERSGLVDIIRKAGGEVICDTCTPVAPHHFFLERGFNVMATNSAKAAHCNSSMDGLQTLFGTIENCVDAAVEGLWRSKK